MTRWQHRARHGDWHGVPAAEPNGAAGDAAAAAADVPVAAAEDEDAPVAAAAVDDDAARVRANSSDDDDHGFSSSDDDSGSDSEQDDDAFGEDDGGGAVLAFMRELWLVKADHSISNAALNACRRVIRRLLLRRCMRPVLLRNLRGGAGNFVPRTFHRMQAVLRQHQRDKVVIEGCRMDCGRVFRGAAAAVDRCACGALRRDAGLESHTTFPSSRACVRCCGARSGVDGCDGRGREQRSQVCLPIGGTQRQGRSFCNARQRVRCTWPCLYAMTVSQWTRRAAFR